uniref:Dienelactone hydrolase domain-containing protein n=1 Tax=Neobodo designis TaxID=312471 RepID=A0A7S1Q490_NEODS
MSCCPTEVLPVKTTYDRQGDNVYITGEGNTKGLLFVPDIFGPHPNAYHVADILAGKGFLVVVPDFFRGKEWPLEDFPPKDGFAADPFQNFIKALTYDNLKPRVEQGLKLLKALGATSIGAVGFCWGGKIAISALGEGLVKAAASPHPSFFTVEDAKAVKGPFALLPSKDDGELADVKAALNPDFKHVYHYFDDMHHGFCAARADFTNELNRTRANECINIMADFFNANL